MTEFGQSRDIPLKTDDFTQSCSTLIAVVGAGFPVPGKQLGDIGSAVLVFRDSPDHVLEPFSRVDAAGFAGRNERVDVNKVQTIAVLCLYTKKLSTFVFGKLYLYETYR